MGRQTEGQGTPLAPTVWFAAGYFLVWVAFALLATLVQWAFERTALLDSAMASTSNVVGGLLFVAAGSYQWTRLKDVCLTQCQMPFAFLIGQGGFRNDAPGSLMLGVRHGVPPTSNSAISAQQQPTQYFWRRSLPSGARSLSLLAQSS